MQRIEKDIRTELKYRFLMGTLRHHLIIIVQYTYCISNDYISSSDSSVKKVLGIVKKPGLPLRQSYTFVLKDIYRDQRFRNHPKNRK